MQVAFAKLELTPGVSHIADIEKCLIFKVNKDFTTENITLPFFPSNIDTSKRLHWRSLSLESDLNLTRGYLNDVESAMIKKQPTFSKY